MTTIRDAGAEHLLGHDDGRVVFPEPRRPRIANVSVAESIGRFRPFPRCSVRVGVMRLS
jgi:hypothetical protein